MATDAPRNVEYRVKTDVLPSGEKWFDGYDPSTGNLLDGKRYENWPKDELQFSIDKVQDDIVESAKAAASVGRNVEFRVKTEYGAAKMKEILAAYNDTLSRLNRPTIENVIIRKHP
ncbi:MAG: Tox-REase-5 domain-containing protein [Pseudomonadota bacterium]